MNPKSLDNLKTISDENRCKHPPGRPKLGKNILKDMPKDAYEQVCRVLWTAISASNVAEAEQYIKDKAQELPELGFALQTIVRELHGKNGFAAFMAILDRLFGKPRQTAEINGSATPLVLVTREDTDAIDKLKK